VVDNKDNVVFSTVEKLLQQAQKREEQLELSKEEMAQFKRVANSLLASKNGQYFWRTIRKMMGIKKVSTDFSPLTMAARQSLNNLNLMVEGLLDIDVKNKLNEEE
jgi:type III secretory pathway component EscU